MRSEDGAGLVELLVAAGLGLLALAVVATLARGPVAATTAAAATAPGITAQDLVRQVASGAVRSASADAAGPAVAAAGPDHLVLRVPAADGGAAWWRIAGASDGAVVVATGVGAVPSDVDVPPFAGRPLPVALGLEVVVLDDLGNELTGPLSGVRRMGDPLLAAAAIVELRVTSDGVTRSMAIALRGTR